MRKTALLMASMASAMLVACLTAALTALPGIGQTRTATLVGAGDIAACDHANDGATARLVGRIQGTVVALGDNVYPYGTAQKFRDCYDPTWGKYKKRTKPAVDNHEYYDKNFNATAAAPYFGYFGWRAGKPGKGYYAYDRNNWHVVVLNSNCSKVGGCGRRSPQGRWLRRNLANNPSRCTLAYFHHPLYSTANNIPSASVKPFYRMLYDRGADVILTGHAHRYERYAPMTPGGARNPERGLRQFVVGTGGEPGGNDIYPTPAPEQVVKTGTPGVLKLTLGAGSYEWKFVPIAGRTFTDSARTGATESACL